MTLPSPGLRVWGLLAGQCSWYWSGRADSLPTWTPAGTWPRTHLWISDIGNSIGKEKAKTIFFNILIWLITISVLNEWHHICILNIWYLKIPQWELTAISPTINFRKSGGMAKKRKSFFFKKKLYFRVCYGTKHIFQHIFCKNRPRGTPQAPQK